MDDLSEWLRAHAYQTGQFKKGTRIEQLWRLRREGVVKSPFKDAEEIAQFFKVLKEKYKLN